MSMSYGGWTIRTEQNTVIDEDGKYKDEMVTSLEVEDIRKLPDVIYQLIGWGHDLSATAEAIKEATEKQQQAKQAESLKAKRENTAKAKAALDSSMRRFVIAYNKKGSEDVKTAQGVQYGNGILDVQIEAEWPIGGSARDVDTLKSAAERYDYELHIEYIDD